MTLALANYSDLQTTALDFLERSGVTADIAAAPAWIQLAESRLNREIGAIETSSTLTGAIDSRTIDLTSLSLVQPIALFLAETSMDEREVLLQANGTFPRGITYGRPAQAAINGTNLEFDRPLDSAYPFRIVFRQRFALSDSATTNWLLTNHPDVYLAATLMWGAGYRQDWQNGAAYQSVLDEAIPSIKGTIAQRKRGVLTVDAGLLHGSRPTYAQMIGGEY